MEFSDLGKHCSDANCMQLDYLPLNCDACENIFCQEHISYNNHNCPLAYKKDVRVPVCPLCNTPIPVKRGEVPDISVSAHIDSNCMFNPANNRSKVFTNKCSVKNCRVKEAVRILCSECKLNFCLKHRHTADHQCQVSAGAARRRAAEAAAAREAKSKSNAPSTSNHPARSTPTQLPNITVGIQGGLSEHEALARALTISLNGSLPNSVEEQIREDHMLARAIAESEGQQQQQQQDTSSSSLRDCCIIL